jgi:hypothetical protein
MSTSLKSSLNGQGRFEIPEKFHLKIPQRGFGSFSVRNGFHKSFITNDLAWTLTWTTPEKSLCARPACLAWLCSGRQAAGRRSCRHDA